jgi:hypothetical protein
MLNAVSLVSTLCDISLSSLCIRTTDIQMSSIFFRQLVCMLCLQYLFAVVGRSKVRSTERSIIVSLSLGKYHAVFLKVISLNCPLFISARMWDAGWAVRTSHRRWLLCVFFRKCAHLQWDKKHSKSPVDAGFVYDKARAAQNFHKSRGPPQNCRCQKGDMKQFSYWGPTDIRH